MDILTAIANSNLGEYQKEIDRKIKQIVDNYGIPYISVSGSTEERVQQIKDAVFGKKEE